jgi:putative DNA-invertase from lambdoid prophage Rac
VSGIGDVHGLGRIAEGVGELILAVLSQVADLERRRIKDRTAAGRELVHCHAEENRPDTSREDQHGPPGRPDERRNCGPCGRGHVA